MIGLYARCVSCNGVFEAPNLFGGNCAAVNLAGNSVSPCTICGKGPGLILDGTYNLSNDQMTLVDGPQSSWDALKELAAIVKASVEAGEAPEKTIDRIAAIDPRLKKYKTIAGTALLAISALLTQVSNLKTTYDIYDLLSGNKAKADQAMLATAAEQGAATALEKFHASLEFKELQERLSQEEEQEATQKTEAPSGIGLRPQPHPFLVDFPITARKLAEDKRSRKHQ